MRPDIKIYDQKDTIKSIIFGGYQKTNALFKRKMLGGKQTIWLLLLYYYIPGEEKGLL